MTIKVRKGGDQAHQKLAYEIHAFEERVIKRLDLLSREVLGQSLEGESASDHLEYDAAERP